MRTLFAMRYRLEAMRYSGAISGGIAEAVWDTGGFD